LSTYLTYILDYCGGVEIDIQNRDSSANTYIKKALKVGREGRRRGVVYTRVRRVVGQSREQRESQASLLQKHQAFKL
jgi:hypothetical protein